MKKILFFSFFALLALASCTKFASEKTSKSFREPISPFIVINNMSETSVSFSVNPADNTNWYAFTLLEGKASESVTANKVLTAATGGIVEDVLDYAVSGASDVEVNTLSRNTTYTIYAVATSETGVVSTITTKEFTTGDTESPEPVDEATEGNVYQLLFSEAVSITDGLNATAEYYAINKISSPIGKADVDVSVNGRIVTFTVTSDLPAGAYYTISYPEGFFQDAKGNMVEALTSSITGLDENGFPDGNGIIGHIDNENFDLEIYGGTPVEIITSLTSPIWIAVPESFVYYKYHNDLKGSIVYDYSNDDVHTVSTYPFSGFPDYGWNGTYNCALTYPNVAFYTNRPDPLPGSMITITIPGGFLEDIYGNVSKEFVIGPFMFAFDYTLEDVIGTYVVDGSSCYGEIYDEDPFEMVIEKSDDEEKGNVMITSYYGYSGFSVYGTFDGNTAKLSFPVVDEYLGTYVDTDENVLYEYYFLTKKLLYNGIDGISFSLSSPGVIDGTDSENYLGYYTEFYNIPEGGITDITDEDYIDYDYNFFDNHAERTSVSSVKSVSRMVRKPASFTRKPEKEAFSGRR